MVRGLLVRGMLAGLLSGVLGFCFAWAVGESQVNRAISFEEYVEYQVHHEEPEDEVVSRGVQSTAGLGTATLIYGVALGGIFALVFAATYGRLRPLAARGTAALLGLLGFTAVYLVPFLKYPANPPAVGDPDTIQYRTYAYLAMMLVSVVAMALCVMLQQRLIARFGTMDATLLAAGAYVVIILVCYLALPAINEVPQQALPGVIDAIGDDDVTFPPSVLWAFRISSIGLQAVIWTTIGLVFGVLAQRQLEAPDQGRRVAGTAR
jgi:predicted cobalt transporter CbtA